MLSVSISGYSEIIDASYDLPAISKAVDFMTFMSYDYHGAWEGVTGHVSPLRGKSSDKFALYTTVSIQDRVTVVMVKVKKKN